MSKYKYVSWHSRMHEECRGNREEYLDRCSNLSADEFVAYQIGEVLKFWDSTNDYDWRWDMLLNDSNSARDALNEGDKDKIAMSFYYLGGTINQMEKFDSDDPIEMSTFAKLARSNLARAAGKAEKRPGQRIKAKEVWIEWGKNPSMFRNKTEFCLKLANIEPGKQERICSINTAIKWFDEFREKHPQPSIEHLLPRKS
ncbi:hypothetical protein [Nitrosomonas sp.]|uniref:hypothetical protein n=1 Tax=Nitrosomonas sp. TaxID=42353 RepID=UPI002609A506|nr:hypothetical protein [Nitrosomonas sp.]MCW5602433.1 hypothetical protein [Nitrosomonas sp.]